jgi:tetratricopeptide (TPR) repeat protein/SAM-dependent methyltransferase
VAAILETFSRDASRREAREGQALLERGKLPQAVRRFNQALQRDPQCVPALIGLGDATFRDGRYDLAASLFRKALEHAPDDPTLWGWLGTAQLALEDIDAAEASLERARALGLEICDIHRGLGRIAMTRGDVEAARGHWERALELDPASITVSSFLGVLHLSCGNWLQGWRHWADRPQRVRENLPQPHWAAADLNGRDVLVLYNQGLGDELFFLRWLPQLRARGARVIYRSSPKLAPLLARLDTIDELVPEVEGAAVPDHARVANQQYACLVDDFPLALGEGVAGEVAPSLRIDPEPTRVAALRERLAAVGPAPYIGVTWRGGTAPSADGRHENLIRFDSGSAVRTKALYKEVPLADCAHVLGGVRGTLIALQRKPAAGELAAFAAAAGRDLHDFTACNDDLENMLALVSLLDDYVCVSNTNVHLRAAAGLPSRVLIPFPSPDWRWMREGDESPWFPGSRTYRQDVTRGWESALSALGRDLAGRWGRVEPLVPAAPPHQEAGSVDGAAGDVAEPLMTAPPGEVLDALLAEADACIRAADVPGAMQALQAVLSRDPGHAGALHGLARLALRDGRHDLAEALCRKALEGGPRVPAIESTLALALAGLDRMEEAQAAIAAARVAGNDSADLCRAAGRIAFERGDWTLAGEQWRHGLQLDPNHLACAALLGNLHLALGEWEPGWRLQSCSAKKLARNPVQRLWGGIDFGGRTVLLFANEGLGDELFSLRWLPALRARRARIACLASPKLAPLILRNGLVDEVLVDTRDPQQHAALQTRQGEDWALVTELPSALGAAECPASIRLSPLPARLQAIGRRLASLGPSPYVGLTWRAGTAVGADQGAVHYTLNNGQRLHGRRLDKSVDIGALAPLAAALPGTLVSLQRNPAADELARLGAAAGRVVHDFADANEDLEDMLALLALLDEYVCVSNTNTHLREALGLGSRVLVPFPPPDWRWGLQGSRSPCFPASPVYREDGTAGWASASAALAADLESALGKRVSMEQAAGRQRVFWVTHGALALAQGRPVSALASARLRVLMPAAELAQQLDSRFLSERECPDELSGNEPPSPDDVLVISKSFSPDTTRLLLQTKKRGTRVVVDVCDNHFDHPEHGPHLRFLTAAADALVVNTPAMQALVREKTGRDATLIGDPFEGPQGAPSFEPGDTLRLLWFGHPANADTLIAALPGLAALASRRPLHLAVVTAPGPHVDRIRAGARDALQLDFVAWTPAATWAALAECDLVIVPTLDGPTKLTRSANRLVESLRAGRFAIVGPQPSHEPLAAFTRIDGDIAAGIEWALAHAEDVRGRIAAGQRHVAVEFAPDAIAARWLKVLHAVRAGPAHEPHTAAPVQSVSTRPASLPASQPVRGPVRLNLGCGDKILPGYVNVDVVASRAGRKPDVQCDLHLLEPFADDSVDEILAVHVVEHFWRWEVLDVLKEWVRVLKPGGRMVLECPNLISACEEFLRDPEVAASGGRAGQRSMWVFYGDPQWRDPYMVHRWGYTPKSLAALMAEAGLVGARQEPAQFKLREPRDMRVVAEKPARGLRQVGLDAMGIRITRFR